MTLLDFDRCTSTSQMAGVVARHFAPLANPVLKQPIIQCCTRGSMRAAIVANDPNLLILNGNNLPLLAQLGPQAPPPPPIAPPPPAAPKQHGNPIVNAMKTVHKDPIVAAMLVLEQALIEIATDLPVVTPQIEAGIKKFGKAAALAMNPGTKHEGMTAFRKALVLIASII